MELFNDYMFFFHLPPITSHLHPLQVESCDSISWLVVDEDDNGKFRLGSVNGVKYIETGMSTK